MTTTILLHAQEHRLALLAPFTARQQAALIGLRCAIDVGQAVGWWDDLRGCRRLLAARYWVEAGLLGADDLYADWSSRP